MLIGIFVLVENLRYQGSVGDSLELGNHARDVLFKLGLNLKMNKVRRIFLVLSLLRFRKGTFRLV